MNECDAPESNKTDAGQELTRSVPKTTSCASLASSAVTWFTRPREGAWGGADDDRGGGEGLAGADGVGARYV